MKTTLALLVVLRMTISAAPQNDQHLGDQINGRGKGQRSGNGSVKGNLSNFVTASNGLESSANSMTSPSNDDPQMSLKIDPRGVLSDGESTHMGAEGLDNILKYRHKPRTTDVPPNGQTASTISFCLAQSNLPLTDVKQIQTGSFNLVPVGVIPSVDDMPSAKFTSPKNGEILKPNTEFTISMAIRGMQAGGFVKTNKDYLSAPQQLNSKGQIIGHSHVVVETLTALDQADLLDPRKFAFFKGLNAAAAGGILTANVTAGLPAGFYKLSSINTAADHRPVFVPVAQHGSLNDVVYFTITTDGG